MRESGRGAFACKVRVRAREREDSTEPRARERDERVVRHVGGAGQ